MKDRGYVVPSSQARRALASENLARQECVSGESVRALVSWTMKFNEIGNGNYGEVLYSASKAVVATVAVSGSVVRSVRLGVNCPYLSAFSLDASHFGGVTRERDAQTALEEGYTGLGSSKETFGKPTRTMGRPKKTSVGLGRLLVCTARTFSGDSALQCACYCLLCLCRFLFLVLF